MESVLDPVCVKQMKLEDVGGNVGKIGSLIRAEEDL